MKALYVVLVAALSVGSAFAQSSDPASDPGSLENWKKIEAKIRPYNQAIEKDQKAVADAKAAYEKTPSLKNKQEYARAAYSLAISIAKGRNAGYVCDLIAYSDDLLQAVHTAAIHSPYLADAALKSPTLLKAMSGNLSFYKAVGKTKTARDFAESFAKSYWESNAGGAIGPFSTIQFAAGNKVTVTYRGFDEDGNLQSNPLNGNYELIADANGNYKVVVATEGGTETYQIEDTNYQDDGANDLGDGYILNLDGKGNVSDNYSSSPWECEA